MHLALDHGEFVPVISRLCGGWISAFEALGDPYLDDGLAGDSQAPTGAGEG